MIRLMACHLCASSTLGSGVGVSGSDQGSVLSTGNNCQRDRGNFRQDHGVRGQILQVLVLSPRSRTRQGAVPTCLECDSTEASAQFWQEMNSSPSGIEETCPPEITHACKSINALFFHFFPKFQDGTVQSEWSYPLRQGYPLLYLWECIFMSLNFSISLDTLYHKRFGKAPRSPVFLNEVSSSFIVKLVCESLSDWVWRQLTVLNFYFILSIAN